MEAQDMGETRRPGRNPRQGVTHKGMKSRPPKPVAADRRIKGKLASTARRRSG